MEKFLVGKLGEEKVEKYLEDKGFKIIEKNYRKKFGELDIIAQNKKLLIFVEVKTFLRKKLNFKPEDEMTKKKIENFKKIALFYANKYENLIKKEGFRLDLAVVFLKENEIHYYENIIS